MYICTVFMYVYVTIVFSMYSYIHVTHSYVGLRSGRDRFLFFLLTMVLVAFASTGQVFAFSAMFKAYNVAYAVLLMIITTSMVSIVSRHKLYLLYFRIMKLYLYSSYTA